MGGGFFDLILVFIFIVLPVVSNLIKASQKKNKVKGAPRKQQQRQVEPNTSQRGAPPTDAQQRQIDVEQKQRDRDAQQRDRQQSPTQPQSAQPVVARQAAEPTGSAASKSDFERRLAEARAKVQQSMSDGDARNPAHRPQTQGPQAQRPQAQRPQANTAQTRQPQPTARQVAPAQQTRPQLQPQARPQQRSLEVLSPLGGKSAKAKTSVRKPALGSSTSGVNGLLGGLSKKRAPKRTASNSDKLLTMDDKSIMRGLIWKQILDTPKSKKRISNYNKIR